MGLKLNTYCVGCIQQILINMWYTKLTSHNAISSNFMEISAITSLLLLLRWLRWFAKGAEIA